MSQKSLPVLNKINTSMVWYTTFYNKYYKWLSMNIMFLVYIYIKILTRIDVFNLQLIWNLVYSNPNHSILGDKFFYPVSIFIVNTNNFILLYNFFYQSTLDKFQLISEQQVSSRYSKININKYLNYRNVWLR